MSTMIFVNSMRVIVAGVLRIGNALRKIRAFALFAYCWLTVPSPSQAQRQRPLGSGHHFR